MVVRVTVRDCSLDLLSEDGQERVWTQTGGKLNKKMVSD